MLTRNMVRFFVFFVLVGMVAYAVNTVTTAQESAAPAPDAAPAATPEKAGEAAQTTIVDVANEKCPFHADKAVDPKLIFVFEGKLYRVCSAACLEEFKKDPKAAIEKVVAGPEEKQVKLTVDETAKCVCGKDVNKDFYIIQGNKLVYCCSKECLDKLAAPAGEEKPAETPATEAPKTE